VFGAWGILSPADVSTVSKALLHAPLLETVTIFRYAMINRDVIQLLNKPTLKYLVFQGYTEVTPRIQRRELAPIAPTLHHRVKLVNIWFSDLDHPAPGSDMVVNPFWHPLQSLPQASQQAIWARILGFAITATPDEAAPYTSAPYAFYNSYPRSDAYKSDFNLVTAGRCSAVSRDFRVRVP
jgi:hypothetical protein